MGSSITEPRVTKKGRKRSRQPDEAHRLGPVAAVTSSEREHDIVHKITSGPAGMPMLTKFQRSPPGDARNRLDAETVNPENAHWYTQDSHTFRLVGTTSGLPVLFVPSSFRHPRSPVDARNVVRQQRGPQNERTRTMTPGQTWEYLQTLIANPQSASPSESIATSEFRIEHTDPVPGDTTDQETRRHTTLYGVFLEITSTSA